MTSLKMDKLNMQESAITPVTALVLAGARAGRDPVAEGAEVPIKVLAPVGGIPMVARVLETLEASTFVEQRVLCGPSWEVMQGQDYLHDLVEKKTIRWVAPQQGPSLSVKSFLEQAPQDLPLLVTTADHALLTTEMVDFFLQEASREQADVLVALVPYPVVAEAYPNQNVPSQDFEEADIVGVICSCFVRPMLHDWWSFGRRLSVSGNGPYD